jgi:hypothetical protein
MIFKHIPKMKYKFTLSALLMVLAFSVKASQPRKVLVIGIDGTRSDALQQANTPNLDGLLANGLHTFDAWHCGITVSGPSWSDIMCGVWENKHGVTSNSYTGSNYAQYPYFVTRAKELKPSLYAVQVTEWAPMSDLVSNDGWDQKIKVPDGAGTPTAAAAVTALANDNLDALFVYFDAVDLAGHASGFNPSNPSYIAAIEGVDGHVGTVLNALYARPNYANEDWIILITTDHGGIGTGHGGGTDIERNIWWIGSGDAIQQQAITGTDPGSYQYTGFPYFVEAVDTAILRQTPVQTDIAVTALHHLIYDTGTNPENVTAWDLDGKSWLKTITSVTEKPTEIYVSVYPNPASDLVSLWFENKKNGRVNYAVYTNEGKLVNVPTVITSQNKLTLNFEGNADGVYFIKLNIGGNEVTKRVLINQTAPKGVATPDHDHSNCNGKH